MLREHPFLISWDHVNGYRARCRGDSGLRLLIRKLVYTNAQPRTPCADARPYFGRMLANPGGEHQAIQATEGSGQCADLARCTEYEQVDRFASTCVITGEKRAHIA